MRFELKKAIIEWMVENVSLFQLTNNTREHFKEYIYTSDGQYLIGGKQVSDFISDMSDILTKKY